MTAPGKYDACLKYMYGLRRFGIKLGLSTIRNILKGLGNPHKRFSAVHIAGTNGKGSIASGIASILKASGYRTGLYTSPHLVNFNERIQISGRQISDNRVLKAYLAVRKVHYGSREPTFFEFATAMAFYEFAEQGVDWGVIETGMGGRLDATNIIKPSMCVISNISLEHKFYLGNSLAEIAAEKGGIIKKNTPLVTGARQPKVVSTLLGIAREKSAPVFRLGKDFRVRRNRDGSFDYYGLKTHWKSLETNLVGRHQIENAALTLAVCELLNLKGAAINETSIRRGLRSIDWPGRLEIVSRDPAIILDGAHNLAAARRLAEFLKKEMGGADITMVMGVLDDKPYQAMLRTLAPMCRRLILTRPVIDRALEPEELMAAVGPTEAEVVTSPDVETAVRAAVESARSSDVVCIAGSLYVVGEAKQTLAKMGISGKDRRPPIFP